jgi:DNA-binding MarR family transcriptional regulator
MEQAGLLVRRQAGRANRLSLTDKGRELYARVVPEHEDVIAQVFSVLSGEEQEQLLGLLRTVDRALS